MIRKLQQADINNVAEIWLNTNLKAHDFIPAQYWKDNFESVKEIFRTIYSEKIVRGYHCPPVQQPYWNTIFLSDFPNEVLLDMIDSAYDTVLRKLSKKEREEINRGI